MPLPYQCLVARNNLGADSNEWILVGASGSCLVLQSSKGATSIWPAQDAQIRSDQQDDDSPEPPGKRIKLEQPKEQKANFAKLILSSTGCYLVGITGEDKCIRVFQIDTEGHLQQLSERCMSRRPCSIILTSDDSTILCADKFGDVYALPLLPSTEDEPPKTPVTEQLEQKDYAPAATALTVHSGRNRRTLEEQLKQKAKPVLKSKEPMRFKHELLLGHVSMLTDIVYAQVDSRTYIITADRDEHIRVSRGQPQSHIIEGFCFGHESFISRLSLTESGLLVSGGGDENLFVWEWQSYRLLEKLPIRKAVLDHLKSRPDLKSLIADEANFQVAVSGLWNVPSRDERVDEVLVACEGIPALFSFKLRTGSSSGNVIPLSGNALDVAFLDANQVSDTIVVSIDNIQTPGSTTEVRGSGDALRMQCFTTLQDETWGENAAIQGALEWFGSQGLEKPIDRVSGKDATETKSSNGTNLGSASAKAVQELLYHIENLRKRPGAED